MIFRTYAQMFIQNIVRQSQNSLSTILLCFWVDFYQIQARVCRLIDVQQYLDYKYSFRKMGNKMQVNYQAPSDQNSSQRYKSTKRKQLTRNNQSLVSGEFFTLPLGQAKPIRLVCLRGKLTADECFYALSTLIQQYYSLFRLYRKVVVSDSLCLVNQFGEIKVDFCIDGPDTPISSYNQVTHSLITTISQIVQMVEGLAFDRDQLESKESHHFRQDLIRRVHQHHQNEEVIFHQILQLLNNFLESNCIKCNLIDAFLRYWKNSPVEFNKEYYQEETPYLANSRITQGQKYSLASKSVIDLLRDEPPKRNQETLTKESQFIELKKSNPSKNFSKYRHKVVRTQGENYYSTIGKEKESFHPSSLYDEPCNPRFQKTGFNRISHQYTLNIVNACDKKTIKPSKINSKPFVSIKGERHQLRRQTSLNEFTDGRFDKKSEAGKSFAKSMLEELARSVSIRDQPNSRDYIN